MRNSEIQRDSRDLLEICKNVNKLVVLEIVQTPVTPWLVTTVPCLNQREIRLAN